MRHEAVSAIQETQESVPPSASESHDYVKVARACFAAGDIDTAYRWLGRVGETRGPFRLWASAATSLSRFEARQLPATRRTVRVAVAGSYTTSHLGALLRVAALRRGIYVELYEAGFNSYAQELLDPGSALYRFDPDYVLIAPHEGSTSFPFLSSEPAAALQQETARWTALWESVGRHSRARIIQHTIVTRPDSAWGHISVRVPGARDDLLRALNARLAEAADDRVLLVDCERVAGAFGKERWFDDRYWHTAKQAVALDALPDLARHTAAVLAAAEGLGSKCLVLDLDNTLWGGVIGEDGLAGIDVGRTSRGEAFVAFQHYLTALRSRGVLLAVVSKNNDVDAREPFERHPDMRLHLDDFAVFCANWDDKASNIKRVASQLNLGLDSFVFVDDNPAERQVVRHVLPEVDVIELPGEPDGYVRALADSLLFEGATVTSEDLARADQYRARAAAQDLEHQATSLEEFYASLDMEAFVAPFDELNVARIVQLIGKTNQFNLTTRRHGLAQVEAFMDDGRFITRYVRLRDRFGDHGLIALMIAKQDGLSIDIDTWLMSCRVIGRTVEDVMLSELCAIAAERGCTTIRGSFVPTSKNAVVADLFARLGFRQAAVHDDGSSTWTYDINDVGVHPNEYIRTIG